MSALHFIHQSIVPVRSTPSDAAEMVTQLLFGEIVSILGSDHQWRHIKSQTDGYQGWVDEKMLVPVSNEFIQEIGHWEYLSSPYTTVLYREDDLAFPFKLVLGSPIPIAQGLQPLENIRLIFGDFQLVIPRTSLRPALSPTPRSLVSLSEDYLGTPYLWGGRSPWGIDCSGLVQQIYQMHGIALPRDASQQVEAGIEIPFAQAHAGDLAFFENDKGRIHHVGMLLSNGLIRHAHGNVHDDPIDATGIHNPKRQIRTHRLCCVKRIV